MPHTATLKIFGGNGSTLISSDGFKIQDANNVPQVDLTATKLAIKDLSISNSADEDLLFMSKGEKVMSVNVQDSTDYGAVDPLYVLEKFTHPDPLTAVAIAEMCQPNEQMYGMLRFTLWQGIDEGGDNVTWCLRTFIDRRAAEHGVLAFKANLDAGAYDTMFPSMISKIAYYYFGSADSMVPLEAATMGTGMFEALAAKGTVVESYNFYSTVPSYTNIDTLAAPQATLGQDDKVVVIENFVMSAEHGAKALAAFISSSALSAFGTPGAPVDWIIAVDDLEVICWRVFATIDDAKAAHDSTDAGVIKSMFPSWTGVVQYNYLPNDSAANKALLEEAGLGAKYTAAGLDGVVRYYKETVEDPVGGLQPIMKD